jgi:hypothetical protein
VLTKTYLEDDLVRRLKGWMEERSQFLRTPLMAESDFIPAEATFTALHAGI